MSRTMRSGRPMPAATGITATTLTSDAPDVFNDLGHTLGARFILAVVDAVIVIHARVRLIHDLASEPDHALAPFAIFNAADLLVEGMHVPYRLSDRRVGVVEEVILDLTDTLVAECGPQIAPVAHARFRQ